MGKGVRMEQETVSRLMKAEMEAKAQWTRPRVRTPHPARPRERQRPARHAVGAMRNALGNAISLARRGGGGRCGAKARGKGWVPGRPPSGGAQRGSRKGAGAGLLHEMDSAHEEPSGSWLWEAGTDGRDFEQEERGVMCSVRAGGGRCWRRTAGRG